jgi:DNA-binding CsgD family transcriptional regulator
VVFEAIGSFGEAITDGDFPRYTEILNGSFAKLVLQQGTKQSRNRSAAKRMETSMLNLEPKDKSIPVGQLYTWEKDKNFCYIKCNENYARAAGLDSPSAIAGKNDDQMPWRSLADFFRAGDQGVLNGNFGRILIPEKEIMAERTADILVTEKQLLNRAGECIGVTGYFIEITGYALVRKSTGQYDSEKKRLYLPNEFGDEYLTQTEALILERVISGWTCRRIAETLHKSRRTVENHVVNLRKKLQCSSKAELIQTTQSHGLHVALLDIKAQLKPKGA